MSHGAVEQKAPWALFLDVDGTLIELAETPDGVNVPQELKSLLGEVASRLNGALALISGRTIANIDELFAPLRLCASGVHGVERRGPDGQLVRVPIDLSALREVHQELSEFARSREGILIEDKRFAIAVHFRLAPEYAAEVHEWTERIVGRLGSAYVLQAGKCVYEIRPSATTKGTAVRTFMEQEPFAGRQPVYIGDDVTDEDAFEAVNALRGISVRVGDAATTRATHRLASVTDVHRWIRELPTSRRLMRAG